MKKIPRKIIPVIIICIIFILLIPMLNTSVVENVNRPMYYKLINYHLTKEIEKIKEEKLYTKTDDTMYTISSVNIRKGPSTSYDIITTVPINTCFKRVAIGENGWSRIIYNNEICYINSNYLSDKQIEIQYVSYFVKTNGNIKGNLVELADNYWTKIPENIKTLLINNGWEIIITTEDLATKFGYSGSIAGMTEYGAKKIYLEDRTNAIKNALIHEVGHAVDAINGFPSLNNEFIDIYNSESQYFVDSTANGDGHEALNPIEYFASVFSEYVINKSNCEATAPLAYQYIQNYIQ